MFKWTAAKFLKCGNELRPTFRQSENSAKFLKIGVYYSHTLAYIVYMGDRLKADLHGPSIHRRMVEQVLGRQLVAFDLTLTDISLFIAGILAMNGVVSVFPNGKKQLHTTRTWEFMGFPQQTDKINTGSDVIIGVIDTGIWPESDSFDDTGFGPPPVHLPNLQHYLKIVGARYYKSDGIYGPRDFVSPRDSEGHGTHVASTAAGGMVNTAGLMGLAAGTARGAVPSARLAIYKACWSGFCEDADILAAFDDAIAGGVNIVSLSAGGDSPLYYFNNSIAIGSFHAMRHGILTSTSAGNDGPTFGTIGDYSPWQLSVAASTIDRKFFTKLKLGNGRVYQVMKKFSLNT
ncbi:cucumisin-like [Apium graveolens]|uniref:cucumisin-like n=1 Tax=Apium graveolens TaxID=4045 RepID=UPI003D7B67CA